MGSGGVRDGVCSFHTSIFTPGVLGPTRSMYTQCIAGYQTEHYALAVLVLAKAFLSGSGLDEKPLFPDQLPSTTLTEDLCWKQGCAPIFRLFPTTGTCSGHALRTCVCFWTSWASWTSRTCFRLLRFRLRCCWIGSARSGLRSHGYPIIAWTRSTELRRSSAALPYVLTIMSSCSADSGLTQPPAAAYASHLTHAVCPPHVFKRPWTCLLFLSSTSWSLGQVSLPVQAVVVLILTWSLGQIAPKSA
jgi:hypothetical protein